MRTEAAPAPSARRSSRSARSRSSDSREISATASAGPPPWTKISDDTLAELRRRSTERVAASEDFKEIEEKLEKLREEEDVIHLAELIAEREEAEREDGAEAEEADGDAASKKSDEDATSLADDDEATSEDADESDASEEEEEEPTPQQLEALNILADLVELQETSRSTWRAPQSASRSEPRS